MAQSNRRYKTTVLIKRFLPYYARYKKTVFFDLFCASLTTACELAFPMLVRGITGVAVNAPESLTLALIFKTAAVYILLRIVDTTAYHFMAGTGHIMGTRMETDMRRDLFAHLQTLSYSFYSDTKVGQIMSRITGDLFDITEFAHHCPEELIITGLKIILSFVILLTVNVPLTLILFAVLPIMLFCCLRFRNRMRGAFKESRYKTGELNAQVEDTLLGIRVVKSFANEAIEEEKFDKGNRDFFRVKSRFYHCMADFQSTTRFFEGFMYIVVVAAGSIFLMKRYITVEDFTAYILYVATLTASLRMLIEFSEQFQKGITGLERFVELMDEKPTVTDREDALTLTDVRGKIDFDHVSFRYEETDTDVLSDINLHIRPGENVALVGASGSGKTTVCNLIPRFYDVTKGCISVDDHPITDLTRASLRRNIGIVQQDVYMFSGTVRENIEYGKPGASFEEIRTAAEKAGADSFISALPNGYDTYIGERGVKLSGGQKQRLSIARVFLKNPPILILDEATSALDNESEKLIQKSLEALSEGRTVLTIAHRLSTVRNADRILVITDDGIEEEGTHDELMQKNGLYAHLYNL